jgi:hypothetical protein
MSFTASVLLRASECQVRLPENRGARRVAGVRAAGSIVGDVFAAHIKIQSRQRAISGDGIDADGVVRRPIASPFFAKPFGTSQSPKGAKKWATVDGLRRPGRPNRKRRFNRDLPRSSGPDPTRGPDTARR